MDQQTRIVDLIDGALESFGARDLVAGAEVLDFLLDLRLAAIKPVDDAEIDQLIESERATSPS
jgi:hypothetical protein